MKPLTTTVLLTAPELPGLFRGVAGALQQCVSLVWKVSNTRRTLTCRGMVKRILRNRPGPDAIED
jgi:hypothetical protein